MISGFFWPLPWPLIGLVLFGRGSYWLFDKGFDTLTEGVAKKKQQRLERRAAKALPPVISVPCGAIMTPEAYRILKPMVAEFERTLPVLERE